MKTLKKLADFKKEFTSLEKNEMIKINGGHTHYWTEKTNRNGCADQDSMAQDCRWDGSKWVKWGVAYKVSTCLEDSSCGL
jgi:hypothetical protein